MSEINTREFLLLLLRKNHSKARNKNGTQNGNKNKKINHMLNYSREDLKIYSATQGLFSKIKQTEISPNLLEDVKEVQLIF